MAITGIISKKYVSLTYITDTLYILNQYIIQWQLVAWGHGSICEKSVFSLKIIINKRRKHVIVIRITIKRC